MIEDKLMTADKAIYDAIRGEYERQQYSIELIASENITSRAIMEAQGSVLTNKYAEGYPSKRYYDGCEYVDVVESLAIERGKKLFKSEYINVQPHSGSQANMGVYLSVLKPGDKILGMSLSSGGHLTHGAKVSFSGKFFESATYDVDPNTYLIDYDAVMEIAKKERPKMIIAGGSAYPRVIDFAKFREIADSVGAYFTVDMAHFGGLVAAGLHPSPVPYADFVTGTTHKTLRGPRGGYIIATNEDNAKKIDKMIFPGIQGGPLMHVIAAKAVCFLEGLSPEYKEYQTQVMKNAKTMTDVLIKRGYKLISGGTDTHLMLVDLKSSKNITGKIVSNKLDLANITANKNGIPFDTEKPAVTSGIRLGTPAITTRGVKEDGVIEIVSFIDEIVNNIDDDNVINKVKEKVAGFCSKYPIYNYLK